MWKLLALCAAFVAATTGSHHGSDVEDKKLMVSGGLIHHLDKSIQRLKPRIEKNKNFYPDDINRGFYQRVQDAEGHCEFGYFQCGDNYIECLDSLKVCDGVKDCFNGHDEDEEICYKSYLSPGTQFGLRLSWDNCETWPDKHYDVHLRHLHRSKTYLGVADVVLDLESKDHKYHLVVKGHYNYGKKELFLTSDHARLKNYQFVCDFLDGNKGRAKCYIETKSSLFHCGTGYLLEK